MATPEEKPDSTVPIGPWLFIFGGLLAAGLGYLGMRNVISGAVLQPPPIVGEWQAYRSPWRLTFNEDKTVVSAATSSGADDSPAPPATPGTYRVDFFGTLWVNLNDGRTYTAGLRPELPNQFDLVESATDVVTVFERVLRLPQPIPENVPIRPPSG